MRQHPNPSSLKYLNAVALLLLLFLGSCNRKSTCSDGILNQGESKIDCGGPCSPCATCSDGLQNQDETSVDCGGKCSVCETCSDGIQNQSESGVDCGGPCKACELIFPTKGIFGINALRMISVDTGIVVLNPERLSLAANVPEGQSLRIKMTDLKYGPTQSTSWNVLPNGPWVIQRFNSLNFMTYTLKGPATGDASLYNYTIEEHFKAKLEYFKNNDTLPFFTKTLGWLVR